MKHLLTLNQASDEAVRFVLNNSCMDGNGGVLEFVLQQVKPCITITAMRLISSEAASTAMRDDEAVRAPSLSAKTPNLRFVFYRVRQWVTAPMVGVRRLGYKESSENMLSAREAR